MNLCKHCNIRKENKPRGLCLRCYTDKNIRAKYPLATTRKDGTVDDNSTKEEVEAFVAEQYKNLPDWWGDAALDVDED